MEELYHLGDERVVALVSADRAFTFFALRRSVVALRVFAINTHAAAAPGAGDLDQALGGRAAFDALAAFAHDSEKRFDAVNAVPEKVRMRLLEVTGAGGFRAQDLADGTIADGLRGFAVAERG